MTETVLTVHQWFGYAIALVVLLVALSAYSRAKDGREFEAGPYRLTFAVLIVQVLLGVVLYGMGGYWDDDRALIAYVHPLLALAALGAGQALLGRARKTQMAADAHRLAGRGLMLTLILVLAAIGVSSAV